MHAHLTSLVLGTLFGFLLAFAGATNFSLHAELFLFENLWLLFVIGWPLRQALPVFIYSNSGNPTHY